MDYLKDSHRSMFAKLLPSAIGALLSETVASLIDTIILSYYLGADILSTVSICMPIYMFVNVLSMLIVSGGATLFAQSLGSGDMNLARSATSQRTHCTGWASSGLCPERNISSACSRRWTS